MQQTIRKRNGGWIAGPMVIGAAVILLVMSGHAADQPAKSVGGEAKPARGTAGAVQQRYTAAVAIQHGYTSAASRLPRRVKELGIEVVALRLISVGHILDFRYKVIDPEKAKPLLDKKIKPYLLDQASGARMMVPAPPKIGALRQTPRVSKAGQVYFSLFANPGKFIKSGNKVTVVYGDYKIENLVVE
ncbi:MAG TPA: hypothetical protein VHN12_07775 [Geobacteraceae bacterium]|nr:hypothetical protein [Geobacteraceae bacterium]